MKFCVVFVLFRLTLQSYKINSIQTNPCRPKISVAIPSNQRLPAAEQEPRAFGTPNPRKN